MNAQARLLSAMCPNGPLHLGHYHGALKSWSKLQYEFDCFFMIADMRSINLRPAQNENLEEYVNEMLINWLAAGIDPSQATIFIQSKIPELFELVTLLGAVTPLSWLERVPAYKEQIDSLEHTDLNTYGFLGLPLLHCSDIITFNARYVTIKEEQIANVELTREVARRFNHMFGREEGFEEKALDSIKKLGAKKADIYEQLLVRYQQNGDEAALDKARFLLQDALNLANGDRERLFAFLENKGKVFLQEPQLLSESTPRLLGLDGQRMSYLNQNTLNLREDEASVTKKIRSMVTDPARIRRADKGNPDCCPVWSLHQLYTTPEIRNWVQNGCSSAGIGCLECKQPLIDAINHEQQQLINNAAPYREDPTLVKRIISDGCTRARDVAAESLKQIKQAMNIDY